MSRYVEVVNPDITSCIHCGGNAGMDAHAVDCPMFTDLWTVGPREVDEGMCCIGCSRPFELGEPYTGSEVLCLGCATTDLGGLP